MLRAYSVLLGNDLVEMRATTLKRFSQVITSYGEERDLIQNNAITELKPNATSSTTHSGFLIYRKEVEVPSATVLESTASHG